MSRDTSDGSNTGTNPKRQRKTIDSSALVIKSLNDLVIRFAPDIADHLASQHVADEGYVGRLTKAMKTPVAKTVCRVNTIRTDRAAVLEELRCILSSIPHLKVQESLLFSDVIEIEKIPADEVISNLSLCTKPKSISVDPSMALFTNWPTRKEKGWPMTHRAILCDRFCGEAVLRGSDIFVRGILAADAGIQSGEKVAVYADIPVTNSCTGKSTNKMTRGMVLENYAGHCVFLGLGTMACSRSQVFNQPIGVAVSMSLDPSERVGPLLPPLSGILADKIMLQNLPSILVAHVLNPQPGDSILDMCAAPGGKTAHMASLVKNEAFIVACDRSRKKMVSTTEFFKDLGATCVTSLALDSTKCVGKDPSGGMSVKEVIQRASINPDDGLKNVKCFPPNSFDKILLDPPCSALGLRPKLAVAQQSLRQLEKHSLYQRKFVDQAVQLLKPGGFMTYSTCTMNSSENEAVIHHLLTNYPSMELIPLGVVENADGNFGRPGLQGVGLTEEQCYMVRRFDPADKDQDTMGFFVARLRKRTTTF